MIESSIIEWLDFGDSAQNIDIYSKNHLITIFKFMRTLLKNKNFPLIVYLVLILFFFVQIWTICIINVTIEKEFLLDILSYLKNISILYEVITSDVIYKKILLSLFWIIFFDFIIMIVVLFTNSKINSSYLCILINIINIIIFYYIIGPVVVISLTSIWCENGIHKYLKVSCFSNSEHLFFTILSFIMLLLYFFISFIFSFYCNEIDLLSTNSKNSVIRINCNYELFCLISKILIFIFGFFFYKMDYEEEENFSVKIVYESYIFIICLIMSIYSYKYVYFYNNIINNINHFGWYFSCWFAFCVLLKTLLNLNGVSNFIVVGWIIITFVMNKSNIIKENLLITEANIFELKNIKYIEIYKNVLLNKLADKNSNKSKILIFGIIKKFEEYAINNPEINYQYQKLLNDKNLKRKFNKEDSLPILSIIYILYSFYLDKYSNKEELVFYMSYFLINKFNNPSYAMLLISKLKTGGHKILYYKYLLTEDIKDYLISKLNKNSNKESIKHVQIGSVILYYLYIDLFKITIYDAICNQIDYFDLLKNIAATKKTTENFLKLGENIFKTRKDIMLIWEKLIELNPFSDECQKDYMLYLESIIQDEFLAAEEAKKYMLLKNNKSQEKFNVYHSMFIIDTSAVLLIDGFLSNGKILYASQNFSFLFLYNAKEMLSLTIDDLIPNVIQAFHKELIDHAVKYSNIKYIFKEPRDSLLKNKFGGLFNIKLFVKPVPNLSYGLIYFTYLQKIHEQKFFIALDKDLKINGFTEMVQAGSKFTMNNTFNLSSGIIGHHIGLIIPEIFTLLEYKNEEFNITKKDYDLKGYLYPVEKVKDLKSKIDPIIDKIKNTKTNGNDYQQGQIEEETQSINKEYNDYMKELTKLNVKPVSIFYQIKLITFIDGKYKYYKILINNELINENEFGINEVIEALNNNKQKKNGKIRKKINLKEEKSKPLTTNKNENNMDNSTLTKNSKNTNPLNNGEKDDNQNQEGSNKNNDNLNEENKQKFNDIKNINSTKSSSLQKTNVILKGYNKIKNDIINKKETFPLKIMKYLSYAFILITLALIIVEVYQQREAFQRLAKYLEQHLLLNKIQINSAILYSVSVNIRWLSHSLYMNSLSHFNEEWSAFFKNLLEQNMVIMEDLKDIASQIEDESMNEKFMIEIYVYKFEETEKFNFTLDNLFSYIINNGIKLMDTFDYFIVNDCGKIPEELGLNEINLKNLIEKAYDLYNLDLNFYSDKDKDKKINKVFEYVPVSLIISGIMILCILSFCIYYTISFHNFEIFFLDKLINFNSNDFENYINKLDQIKKKLRNDNNEEEEKGDEMELNDMDTKKKEEDDEEGNDTTDKKNSTENNEKKKNKKKDRNKQNKIQQQRRKKLNLMISFFRTKNILFEVKIILILTFSLIYYLLSIFIKSKYKNEYISFDSINDALNGVYFDSINIYIKLKRKLDIYERSLINCKTIGNFTKMDIPKINDIIIPKFGNLIMQITSNSNFKKQTLQKFNSLYKDDVCRELIEYSYELKYCEKFWSGVLLKGMEQAVTQMGVVIGTVLDEIQSLNTANNSRTLFSLMNDSSFIEYEQFNEYYLFKAYNKTSDIFKELRNEKLKSIINTISLVVYIYIFLSLFLFGFLIYFVYDFNSLFNSFLNFIGILPPKYLAEDGNFYNEIIRFGNKYF